MTPAKVFVRTRPAELGLAGARQIRLVTLAFRPAGAPRTGPDIVTFKTPLP